MKYYLIQFILLCPVGILWSQESIKIPSKENVLVNSNWTLTETIILYVFLLLILAGIIWVIFRFFKWAERITSMEGGAPNSVLGYNIAFDFMAWAVTGIVIILAFISYFVFDKSELTVLIMGITIGSILTRTPSFKEKQK